MPSKKKIEIKTNRFGNWRYEFEPLERKHSLSILILYFLVILLIVGFQYPSLGIFVQISFIIPLFLASFFVFCKLVPLTWKNKYRVVNFGSYVYDLVVDSKYNFLNKPAKPKKKLEWDRIILAIIFISIPLATLPILVDGTWQDSMVGGGSGKYLGGSGLNEYFEKGQMKFDYKLNLNNLQKISYLVGKEIDFSIVDVCFINKGTSPTKVLNQTFKSEVVINDEIRLEVPYKGENCYSFDRSKEIVDYNWTTSFEYPIEWVTRQGINVPDYSARPNNSTKIRLNYTNLFFVFFVLLISWWALWALILKVFRYLYKGLELNKK